jgi:hypothetical protein
MANRRVIQEKIKTLQQNTANTWSQIGRLILERPNVKVDDTIGPIFDLHFKHDPQKDCPDQFVFIKIKVWDASQMELRGNIYERTYSEYQITGPPNHPITIYKRYRTPFKQLEYDLEYMEHPPGAPLTYKGNPDLLLKGGDVITVEIYTPYLLDVKESSISLELLVLDGHVGPEYIGIASMENRKKLDTERSFTIGQSSSTYYAEVDGAHRMEKNQDSQGELTSLDTDLKNIRLLWSELEHIRITTGEYPNRKTVLRLIKNYNLDEDIVDFLERHGYFEKK